MKKLLFLILAIYAFGGEYYAKQEPLRSYVFASKVSGAVVFVNSDLSGKLAKNDIIVQIDDEISKVSLDVAKQSFEIQADLYKKSQNLSTSSKSQKDQDKIKYLNAKQAYTMAKEDLNSRSLRAKNLLIGDILVEVGSFVAPGTPLFKAYDVSKSKLVFYATKEDIQDIKNKKILVNGKEGEFTLSKYYPTTDDVYVSSYKVELIGKAPLVFSSLLKIQIQ